MVLSAASVLKHTDGILGRGNRMKKIAEGRREGKMKSRREL